MIMITFIIQKFRNSKIQKLRNSKIEMNFTKRFNSPKLSSYYVRAELLYKSLLCSSALQCQLSSDWRSRSHTPSHTTGRSLCQTVSGGQEVDIQCFVSPCHSQTAAAAQEVPAPALTASVPTVAVARTARKNEFRKENRK